MQFAQKVILARVQHVVGLRVDAQLLQVNAFPTLDFNLDCVAHYVHTFQHDAVKIEAAMTDILLACKDKTVKNLPSQLLEHALRDMLSHPAQRSQEFRVRTCLLDKDKALGRAVHLLNALNKAMLQFSQLFQISGSVFDFGDEVFLLDQMVGQNLLTKKSWIHNSLRKCKTLQHLLMFQILCQHDEFAHRKSGFTDRADHDRLVQQLEKLET